MEGGQRRSADRKDGLVCDDRPEGERGGSNFRTVSRWEDKTRSKRTEVLLKSESRSILR